MTVEFDLGPATTTLADVVSAVTDDRLTAPTPCAGLTVRDLLAHIDGLAEAFRQAATKEAVGRSLPPEVGAGTVLDDGWRERIPARLRALAVAWRDPAAWEGDTEAGGVTAPAPMMATIALDEVVVHGWDLARALGVPHTIAPADQEILLAMLAETPPEGTPGLFGPVVEVSETAGPVARLLALTGRRAEWTPDGIQYTSRT